MTDPINICSLEYLIGTIATAYKGVITSLIAKDFCITGQGREITLKGTILSMPEGRYQARLMHEGSELGRAALADGYFELKAEAGAVTNAKNLQIDVVQDGRHIGTFLLKREKKGDFFSPATELSQELSGVDLKRLTANIQRKVGLLKKGEEIISMVLSPKKDWIRLSEEINSFSRDLFWSERDTFYGSYPILIRHSRLASEKLEDEKSLSNFLSLIELPLESEKDDARLRSLAERWLSEMRATAIDLTLRPNQTQKVLKSIHEKVPGCDIDFVLGMLLRALKRKAGHTPVLEDKVLSALKGVLKDSDYSRLAGYGGARRGELLRLIGSIEAMPPEERYRRLLEDSHPLYRSIPDEKDMVDDFFVVIERNLRPESAGTIAGELLRVLGDFRSSSPEVFQRAAAGTVGFMRRLIVMGLPVICGMLMRRLKSSPLVHGQDLLLDPALASVLLDAGDGDLLKTYNEVLGTIIIPAPRISGFSTDTWAEIADPLHMERLRKFLRIISLDSTRFRGLLVHVICNLYISGVFIPDETLFQREISAYLNSPGMGSDFLLSHMLLQKLPVYFNEVGATGRIRDYTTEIDSWGNDTVLYFLRKQVHVNASNYNVRLVRRILECWVAEDPGLLRGAVPEDVIQRLDACLLKRYVSAVRTLFEALGVLEDGKLDDQRLLSIKVETLRTALEKLDATEEIRSKIFLLCRIYREVVKKYSAAPAGAQGEDLYEKLPRFIERMKALKRLIVSPEKTSPEESLYYKRHIAFGIPSVMGSYHEPKFNAMGELLRNEETVRVFFEQIAAETAQGRPASGEAVLERWITSLSAMNDLFHVLGLGNFQLDELMVIFRTNRLYSSQIADMLGIWQKELTWMVESLHRTFYLSLTRILEVFPREDLPGRLRGIDPESGDFTARAANIIMRDIMGSLAGLVELDNVLDNLVGELRRSEERGRIFTPAGEIKIAKEYFLLEELGEGHAMKLAPLIGTKAKNLVYLRGRGLNVPHGVVFLSRRKDNYEEYTESAGFAADLKEAVKKLEDRTGAFFGGAEKPLFLSVRSGSYISMPGILSSILYCGMNSGTVDAFAKTLGDHWTAWDSYRRFLFHYGTVVHGLDATIFENISDQFLREGRFKNSWDLGAGEMKQLAGLYLEGLKTRGLQIPEDVYDQLREAVKAVYRSWHSERADQFRKALNVSEQWGTSVILMEMIPGNASGAGASVFFTRDPSTLQGGVFGDTRERATGDDLVYGGMISRPLAKKQALAGMKSLEETDPELFSIHRDLARSVEEALRGLPQEVEATYIRQLDGTRLMYVLQTRRMEFHRGFTRSFLDVCKMEESIIGRGTGVHGGALSGIATFASARQDIRDMRTKLDMPVVLLRRTASTDDISLMPEIDGILTSSGGATSHASILARKFGLAAVVGCSDMVIDNDEEGEFCAKIGDYTVKEGAVISIDGSTGLVYSGTCFLPGASKNA